MMPRISPREVLKAQGGYWTPSVNEVDALVRIINWKKIVQKLAVWVAFDRLCLRAHLILRAYLASLDSVDRGRFTARQADRQGTHADRQADKQTDRNNRGGRGRVDVLIG